MTNILDHVPQAPLLEGIQGWPRSCSREEWFRITRAIVAGVIADMAKDLDDAELSLVEEHFIAAGLLCPQLYTAQKSRAEMEPGLWLIRSNNFFIAALRAGFSRRFPSKAM